MNHRFFVHKLLGNRNTPAETLAKIALQNRHSNQSASNLISHPNSNLDIQNHIADSHPFVAATMRAIHPSVLAKLHTSSDADAVAQAISHEKSTPEMRNAAVKSATSKMDLSDVTRVHNRALRAGDLSTDAYDHIVKYHSAHLHDADSRAILYNAMSMSSPAAHEHFADKAAEFEANSTTAAASARSGMTRLHGARSIARLHGRALEQSADSNHGPEYAIKVYHAHKNSQNGDLAHSAASALWHPKMPQHVIDQAAEDPNVHPSVSHSAKVKKAGGDMFDALD